MLRIINSKSVKLSQNNPSFLEETGRGNVDWGDEEDPLGFVGEDNYEDYLPETADETEKAPEDIWTLPEPTHEWEQTDEFESPEGAVDYIMYDNSQIDQLLSDAYSNQEMISFQYTNRFGRPSYRSNVEVHGRLFPSTGNNIIITFDNSVGDIRAFDMDRMQDGVRHRGQQFGLKARLTVDRDGNPLEGL